ncbi:hypothetical protein [Idiomarina abyssalis]|uniref:hypothetical protein n=1 Tax=Idiomarina abyssalis TaxID=86102 RepID=UPI003A8E194D
MKLLDIVTKVGGGILSAVVPGAAPIIAAVNAFLPEDSQVPESATGTQISSAISSLPADKQAELLGREFDVDITQIKEENATLRAVIESDINNPQSTRPYIAKQSFHLLALVTIIVAAMWGYSVIVENDLMTTAIMDGWPFIATLLGTFATVLLRYFGAIQKEQKQRLDAAGGISPSGFVGAVKSLFK